MLQCSFGKLPCNRNGTFKTMTTDQGLCLSFNPGKRGTKATISDTVVLPYNENHFPNDSLFARLISVSKMVCITSTNLDGRQTEHSFILSYSFILSLSFSLSVIP